MDTKTVNLQNQLFIALPGMGDPNFDHTVTLICQYRAEGVFGLIINRPSEVTIGELFYQLNIPLIDTSISGESILRGGPIQPEQGFVLHAGKLNGNKIWNHSMKVSDDLFVTTSRDILVDIGQGKGPNNFLLILGCSGWIPGQIEKELLNNIWLTCNSSAEILFEMPYESRWRGSAKSLGIDLNLLSNVSGHS